MHITPATRQREGVSQTRPGRILNGQGRHCGDHGRAPGRHVLVTTGTVTSAHIMAERLPPGAFHHYVPIDAAGPVIANGIAATPRAKNAIATTKK